MKVIPKTCHDVVNSKLQYDNGHDGTLIKL
jgi:hypothetical protein